MAITTKGKGLSGGARVITYLHVSQHKVYLLAVYDKSDTANILDKEIEKRLALIKDLP
jgi:hypothetical protein